MNTKIWLTGDNMPWIINDEIKEWASLWNIIEINLTKKTFIVSSPMPDGMKLNSFPSEANIEVRCQYAGRRDDYNSTEYTRVALFNCSLVECVIIEPVKMWGINEMQNIVEVRATIKYESMEFQE